MSRNIEIGWNNFGPIDKANINRHSLAILVSFQQYEAIQKGWKGKDGKANDSDFLFIISASPTSSALRRDKRMRVVGLKKLLYYEGRLKK